MSSSSSLFPLKPFSNAQSLSTSTIQRSTLQFRHCGFATKCELNEQPSEKGASVLSIGSPIIITEAPKMVKTADSVPCLRVNAGLVNPGDVGRIVSRKPMDVWAIRLSIGTYLIDGKYFKPLKLDE